MNWYHFILHELFMIWLDLSYDFMPYACATKPFNNFNYWLTLVFWGFCCSNLRLWYSGSDLTCLDHLASLRLILSVITTILTYSDYVLLHDNVLEQLILTWQCIYYSYFYNLTSNWHPNSLTRHFAALLRHWLLTRIKWI